ncbi:MAG: exodeoxyribonuclease VII large subunit [Acetobacter sp.]|nr:exodeoxyribonuclease VII large subunit [Acetobacter sp.]
MYEESIMTMSKIPKGTNNVPEYSVSEISGAIKRTLQGAFNRVRVRGEITDFNKRYSSGHLYFSLKDPQGKLSGIVWKNVVPRLGLFPENGLEVVATGQISSYGERSNYYLQIERMEYAGEGAMLAQIERLKQRLTEEGLFEAAHKRPLPRLPSVIGVITSSQGAVLHDIKTTLQRRFPRFLLVWDVPVQGAGAAEKIVEAIKGFDCFEGTETLPRPDVLIVARGGGSLEELMAFNEEAVVRAVAACRIPIISAVGHETDTTLIDYVSDKRAPTPTAAAEMVIPARADLLADITQKAARATSGLARSVQQARLRFSTISARLPDVSSLLQTERLKLDTRSHKLTTALGVFAQKQRERFLRIEHRLPAVETVLASRQKHIVTLGGRLASALQGNQQKWNLWQERCRLSPAFLSALLREKRSTLAGIAGRLEAVSPHAVLARGYVLVSIGEKPITTASLLHKGQEVTLTFADGTRTASIEE